ncbi:MAG: hypothetical protein ACRDWD_08815 [Acidimicrobiia bacterium]
MGWCESRVAPGIEVVDEGPDRGPVGEVDAGAHHLGDDRLRRAPRRRVVHCGRELVLVLVDGCQRVVDVDRAQVPAATGVADPRTERGRHHGVLLGRARHLARPPVGQQDLHDDRAPPQRPSVEVIAAEVDEVAGDDRGGVIAGERHALVGEEVGDEPVARLIVELGRARDGASGRHQRKARVDDGPLRRERLGLDGRDGDVREVERRPDARGGVGERDRRERGVGIVGGERAEVPERGVDPVGYDEGVLHEGAKVVVDVDAERVRPAARVSAPDEHVVAVAEDVGHDAGLVHRGAPDVAGPGGLGQTAAREVVGGPPRAGCVQLGRDGGEAAEQHQRLDAAEVRELFDRGCEHILGFLPPEALRLEACDHRRRETFDVERVPRPEHRSCITKDRAKRVVGERVRSARSGAGRLGALRRDSSVPIPAVTAPAAVAATAHRGNVASATDEIADSRAESVTPVC